MDFLQLPDILSRNLRITLQNYAVGVIITLLVLKLIPWWILCPLLYLGGILLASSMILPLAGDILQKSRVSAKGKAVFITGCDSGFGNALARNLDDLGMQVFAGCLFPDKEGARSLKKSCSDRLHVVHLDVTCDESIQNALKYVNDNIGINKFWALVNNAGINSGGEVVWTSLDTIKRILEVNTFGGVRMTKAFIPLLCRDKGRVVTVASQCGRFTYPTFVPYCMSKTSAISFCEGFRMELALFGVKFITIEPHMHATPLTDWNNIKNGFIKSWQESPDEIKELYPENYLEQFLKSSFSGRNFNISNKPQNVVDCIEEAVMAVDPNYSYTPGKLYIRLLDFFTCRVAKPIADAVIYKLIY